ncbi:hypothetical protein GCM10007108_01860 [Thermogymnomonas acidicola]|uniref:DUF5611 domain-containing protein n=1 Tax=Thermogymnomonas acidicola TaxID=399579 RepID=A0AA37BPW3_9ARCH|nr:DUF5611 family protein [Thermogymnomonas acidicola]GGM67429.1 hypothetical protein GCM10007108_01860 [Thermogymnomonas acidicola]
MVRDYPVKRNFKTDLETLLSKCRTYDPEANARDGHIFMSVPGLKRIEIYAEGKKIFVTTETDTGYREPEKTVKIYNALIEDLTGYSAKERKKMLTK